MCMSDLLIHKVKHIRTGIYNMCTYVVLVLRADLLIHKVKHIRTGIYNMCTTTYVYCVQTCSFTK